MYSNLPKTENTLLNKYDQKLHYRYFLSDNHTINSNIFIFHGYGSNINRPNVQKCADWFTDKGYNAFALDFSGHGYSEGETALIKCADDLIDEAYHFVNYILENYKVGKFFYLFGSSMGGTICVELAKKMVLEKRFNDVLRGCVILSPLIDLKKRYTPYQ